MAKGSTITIGSKLPNAIILNHPMNPTEKVTIKGLNSAPLGTNKQPILIPYATTEVDREFWEAWKLGHVTKGANSFKPFASGAIFECGSEPEKAYRERDKEKTGLEPLNPTDSGVKPAEKD